MFEYSHACWRRGHDPAGGGGKDSYRGDITVHYSAAARPRRGSKPGGWGHAPTPRGRASGSAGTGRPAPQCRGAAAVYR